MVDLTHLTHLDIQHMAQSAQAVSGQVRVGVFTRLMQDVLPSGADHLAAWSVHTHTRQPLGQAQAQVWLSLEASACLPLVCQSCLEPVDVSIVSQRSFRFVASEEQALLEDEDAEEDVLVNPHDVDVCALMEDELILSLPLVPRHGGCIAAYQATPEEVAADLEAARPNPFAALVNLKKTT
jgi:uncharacterized protein